VNGLNGARNALREKKKAETVARDCLSSEKTQFPRWRLEDKISLAMIYSRWGNEKPRQREKAEKS
jgi:hypothetical protein